MCLRQSDFHPGAADVLLGSLEGVPFYTSSWQAQLLGDVSLLIDVVESQSDSFSLEAAEGIRFIARTVETRQGNISTRSELRQPLGAKSRQSARGIHEYP
jgi:uncharacterized protein (DUF779 family)